MHARSDFGFCCSRKKYDQLRRSPQGPPPLQIPLSDPQGSNQYPRTALRVRSSQRRPTTATLPRSSRASPTPQGGSQHPFISWVRTGAASRQRRTKLHQVHATASIPFRFAFMPQAVINTGHRRAKPWPMTYETQKPMNACRSKDRQNSLNEPWLRFF